MTDLLALAGRVEQLTGPCRETDYLICEAVHPFLAEQGYARVAGDNGYHSSTPLILGAEKVGPASEYTASLDAAMTLARNNREAMTMIYVAHKSFEAAEMDETASLFPRIKAMLACNLRARSALEASHDRPSNAKTGE